jgi:hypothetical protein
VSELLSYLENRANDLGSRDDVAMDLRQFDEPEVEAALLKIALDQSEEEVIIDSARDSLREIWERKGVEPYDVELMHPSAQKFFVVRPNPSFKRTPDGAA